MYPYKTIDKPLFIKNRQKLSKMLKPGALAIVHTNDEYPRNGDQFYPFRPNSDFFYLTGIPQPKSVLLLFPSHPQKDKQEILFLLKADMKTMIWEDKKLTKEEAQSISGIENIQWLQRFEEILGQLMTDAEFVYVLADNEIPGHNQELPSRNMRFIKKLNNQYPVHKYERLGPLTRQLRQVKEKVEIELIKQACEITGLAFTEVLKNIRPGMKEYEIEAIISHVFRDNAANTHAYAPIVASGVNACTLHYTRNTKTCKDNELLLMDFGAEYAFYAADLSRTIPVNGKYNKRQKEIYGSVLRAFNRAKPLFIPGNTIDNIQKHTIRFIEEECMKLGLLSKDDIEKQDQYAPAHIKYFMHGVSHFIGLDVHDCGKKTDVLKKGMVLSCEPAIYIRDEGIGVRLENNILIDEKPVDLLEQVPMETGEIEEIIHKYKS